MRFIQQCEELQSIHERAHRDILHVRAALESEVGARLREQQRVILSVLRKINGREVPRSLDHAFHTGCGAWAVALRDGFEVTAIQEGRVLIRALCLPESSQRAATYSLPLAALTRSDREVAARIRGAVRKQKTEAKAYRQWEAAREAKGLARELRSDERRIELLRDQHNALLREASA